MYSGSIDVLPITKEKYISLTKRVQSTIDKYKQCVKLRFIDSYKKGVAIRPFFGTIPIELILYVIVVSSVSHNPLK